MTGKGDRWGRDRIGWSAPAFLAASTTALPPPTCTARREAGQLYRRLLFLLRGRPTAGRCVSSRPVPGGEYAGCVRLPCSAGCVPARLCHAHCPSHLAPVLFILLCPLFHSMCARIISLLFKPTVCKLRELSRWQLQHGPAVAALASF